MSRPIRKVAFISGASYAYTHRLYRGALFYAESHSGLTMRDFCVPVDMKMSSSGRDPLSRLVAWEPDGLLSFLGQEELDNILDQLPWRLPIVSMCPVAKIPELAVVSGSFDTQIRMVVRHFRQLGLHSIAMFFTEPPKDLWLKTFLQFASLPVGKQPSFFEPVPQKVLDGSEEAMGAISPSLSKWLLDLPKPTGVFCHDFGGGGYLIRVCGALGLRVPEDISIITSDDADAALSFSPTLTSVIPVGEKIGSEAVRVLEEMMAGLPAPEEPVRLDAMDLRVRESTGQQRVRLCDIAGAMDYINQYACRGLSVQQLVSVTQEVCGKTFHTHFKAATGMTPGEAIHNRQFEEACRLLGGTMLSVTRISEHCGFNSSSDFSRRFRMVKGMSPTDYRRKSTASSSPR